MLPYVFRREPICKQIRPRPTNISLCNRNRTAKYISGAIIVVIFLLRTTEKGYIFFLIR